MFLYVLQNEVGKLYIGITKSLKRRLIEHNLNNSHFTGKGNHIWKLLFFKEFSDEFQARVEEKRLKKSKNKKYILWYFTKGL